MKIIVSPAKSMDLSSSIPNVNITQPHFLNEASVLNKVLKKKSVKEISSLMGLSENLSKLNWERNQKFKTPFNLSNSRPAVYTFNGDVYSGLNPTSISDDKLISLQNNLRIISGLYGILRPFDLIQPYRLEMSTKLQVGKSKNLYEFWKNKLTNQVKDELKNDDLLVNLASKEYFSAIDFKSISNKIITPQFKDFKNGTLKIISFFAKKARGMMSRYLIENNVKTIQDLLHFSVDGYTFSMEETINQNEPVFIR
ncbi:MAG: hypothetical protein CMC79_00410 [Flavobacteriaceae bacterium]|nr:hypothetical protein [Flavobacteriaceae bacterium]|tara:strand:- start:9494 stop:10255 length:762 start_codon:yes stop_codon:yes gene_type:complete